MNVEADLARCLTVHKLSWFQSPREGIVLGVEAEMREFNLGVVPARDNPAPRSAQVAPPMLTMHVPWCRGSTRTSSDSHGVRTKRDRT